MAQLFISHAETDGKLAEDLALALERRGYTTWYYERDSVPGLSYLLQTGHAIKESSAFIVLISRTSLASNQVTKEIVRAHEESKEFLPILCGVTHIEFQNQQQEWREALGSAASVVLPQDGVLGILPRLERGLMALKILPSPLSLEKGCGTDDATQRGGFSDVVSATQIQDVRVVVVEDNIVSQRVVIMMLEKCGITKVMIADNGLKGLAVIKEFRPHLIIADLCMPVMDGYAMIERLRADPDLCQITILVLSANVMKDDIAWFERQGMPYHCKPIRGAAFKDIVFKLLREPKVPPQNKVPKALVPETQLAAPSLAGSDDQEVFRECTFVFTDLCRGHIAKLNISESDVLALVQGEFRSHSNYLRYDLENYPLPLRSGYIAYLTKIGPQVEFTGFIKCTTDQAKLASWNDILALYRRATRLAYRIDPNKLLLVRGALKRAIELHLDLRTRITKHFTEFERLPVEERFFLMEGADADSSDSSRNDIADEVAYQLRESARANEEASQNEQLHELGDMMFGDAVGTCVMEMERSLQHIHKIITGYPPIA